MAVVERRPSTDERINSLAQKISMAILAAVPGPLVVWLFFRSRFQGLIYADSMDYAQIARHLTQGHGFTTSNLRPLMLAITERLTPQPDLLHAPLHALVMAILFGMMGARDEVAAYSSVLFFVAAIPVLYVLAARMFDRRVATLSTVLYVISDRMLSYAISGLPVSLSTFLTTLLLLVLFGKTESTDQEAAPRKSRAMAIGALTALCFLTEYSALLFVIPVALYLLVTSGRARVSQLVLFLLAFFVVSAPWMLRNYALTRNPLFSLSQYEVAMQTSVNGGYSLYRTAPASLPSPIGFFFSHLGSEGRKMVGVTANLYSQIPLLSGLFVMPFFLVGIFQSYGRRVGRLRACFYGMILVTGISALLLHGAVDTFVPFLPIVFILAAASLLQILGNTRVHPFYQNAAAGLIILVAAFPLLLVLLMGGTPEANPARPSLEDLTNLTRKQDVVVSDIPWAVAWYSDRAAVWMPQTMTDFRRIDEKMGRLNFIYLSSMLRTYPAEEQVGLWMQSYMQGKPLAGFKLAKVYPGPMLLFVRPEALPPSVRMTPISTTRQ